MKTIVLTGPDGTGKSTLCDYLQKTLSEKVIVSSPWDVMEVMNAANPESILRSKENIQQYLKTSDQNSRIYFLFHAICRSQQKALELKPDILLFDGYWYKYAVAEMARGADLKMIMKVAELFSIPDLVLFLDIEPQQALARKKVPSMYESGGATQNREVEFLKFQSEMYTYWKKLKSEFKWKVVDSREDLETVKKMIMEQITHEIKR